MERNKRDVAELREHRLYEKILRAIVRIHDPSDNGDLEVRIQNFLAKYFQAKFEDGI